MKKTLFAFVLFIVVALAVWNLLDYLYASIVTRSAYQFGLGSNLGFPLAGAVVIGYLLFLRNKVD